MKKFLLLLFAISCYAQNITQPPPTSQQRTVSLPAFVPQYLPPYPALAGLKVYISGGNVVVNGTPVYIPSQYVYLQPNSTSFVYVDLTNGVIAQSSSGFPTTAYPVCICSTNGTMITTMTDARPDVFGGGGGGGPSNVLWNNILPPQGSLSLSMGTNSSIFTAGDYGTGPGTFWSFTDFALSTTDITTNLHIGTGNNSFHQPFLVDLSTGGQTFQQLAVYNLGTSHVGITVVGNILPAFPNGSYPGLPGNTGVSGVAKLTVMDNSTNRTQLRLWQNNTSSGSDQLQISTAGVYNASTNPFNFITFCSGGTQYVAGSSFGNGLCGGSNPGSILGSIRGDGTANFFNYIGPLNGVSFGIPPVTAIGYVCALTSQTTCQWQPAAGGGGGTGSQYQSAAFSNTNVISGYGPGLPGQTPVSRGTTNVPLFASAGVAGGNGGTGVVSTNTYTIACDDPTLGTLDRVTSILFTFSGTVAVTLPAPSVSGCGSNFTLKIGASTGTTINLTSAATLVTLDGSSVGSSLSLTAGQYASINSPNNTVYHVWKTYGIGPNLTLTGTIQAGTIKAAIYQTTTNCSAAGTAANPSVVSCSAAPEGAFACDAAASTGTCTVNTTAVTANSNIWVQPASAVSSRLSVTCSSTADTALSAPRLASLSAGTSFTINLGTFTGELCFIYKIDN